MDLEKKKKKGQESRINKEVKENPSRLEEIKKEKGELGSLALFWLYIVSLVSCLGVCHFAICHRLLTPQSAFSWRRWLFPRIL